MNDVTLFSSKTSAVAVTGALRKLAMSRGNRGNKAFMKFTKQHEFLYGAEGIEPALDSVWAVNPVSFCIGVIGWRGGKLVGEHTVAATSPERIDVDSLEHIPTVAEGGKKADGWQELLTFEMKNMADGTEVKFKASGVGARNAVADLADAVSNQIEDHSELPVACIELRYRSYVHAEWGLLFVPVFDIVDWADANGDRPGKAPAPKARRSLV